MLTYYILELSNSTFTQYVNNFITKFVLLLNNFILKKHYNLHKLNDEGTQFFGNYFNICENKADRWPNG